MNWRETLRHASRRGTFLSGDGIQTSLFAPGQTGGTRRLVPKGGQGPGALRRRVRPLAMERGLAGPLIGDHVAPDLHATLLHSLQARGTSRRVAPWRRRATSSPKAADRRRRSSEAPGAEQTLGAPAAEPVVNELLQAHEAVYVHVGVGFGILEFGHHTSHSAVYTQIP
jgi:hypothetical protein